MRSHVLLLSAAAGVLASPCKAPSRSSNVVSGSGAPTGDKGLSIPLATGTVVPSGSVPALSVPTGTAPGFTGAFSNSFSTSFTIATPSVTGVSGSVPVGGNDNGVSGISMGISVGAGAVPTGTIDGGAGAGAGGAGVSMGASFGAGASPTGTIGGGSGSISGGAGGAGISMGASVSAGASPTGTVGGGAGIGGGMGAGLGGSGSAGIGGGASGGASGSCSAPKVAGGDFGFLGQITGNANMSLTSQSGSCSAGVFAGAGMSKRTFGGLLSTGANVIGSVVGSGEAAIGTGEAAIGGGFAGAAGLVGSVITGAEASLSSTVDTGLAGVFSGSNFVQIEGEVAGALQSLCQTVPVCKGKKYTVTIDAGMGADMDGAIDLVWQIAGNAGLKSDKKTLKAGMSAKAGFSWTFTWDKDDLLELPICLLSTIASEGQTLGLANFGISLA